MRLFDDIRRTDGSPASHAEGSYAFLNRAATPYWGRVRDELESWFDFYPAPAKADLRGRFRDRHPTQHFPAWWELYLFTLFSKLGFSVEVHPETGVRETSPDFRCSGDGVSFYLEATTVFSGIVEQGRHVEREAWIMDLINDAKNADFFVWLKFRRVGTERPKRSEVVRPIEEWLRTLDADVVIESMKTGDAPMTVLPIRDWILELRAIPLKPEARGRPDQRLLGGGPISAGFVNDIEMLGRSLSRKFAHYGALDAPLVVGVLAMSGSVDREDVEQALFGREAIQFTRGGAPDDHRLIRQRNGVWVAEGGPVATSVSAVLVSSRLRPWTCATELPEVWLNPWADVPLECSLPFVIARASDEGLVVYDEERTEAWSLLDLPSDWPGPEAPFE